MAGSLLDMQVLRPPRPDVSVRTRLKSRLLPVSRRRDMPGVIYLARHPSVVNVLTALEDFHQPKGFRVLWIVDSFGTEIMPSARVMRQFDLIVYMQKGEAAFYETLAPGRTLYLGWGADVLDLGSANPNRPVDVLRVGRQPEAWDDDDRSADICKAAGLRFSGRPPFVPLDAADPSAGHRDLCKRYAQTKFVIAHSNLAAPADYTHPTKEYLTGRWTDSLAAGAIVAGVQPYGDASAEDLLWPGATLDFDRIDLAYNVEALREAAGRWTPADAAHNWREALIRLDWRWRLRALADALDITAPALKADLNRLEAEIKRAS
jgi:hypothetical protein